MRPSFLAAVRRGVTFFLHHPSWRRSVPHYLTPSATRLLRAFVQFRHPSMNSYSEVVCTDLVILGVCAAWSLAPYRGGEWWQRASLWPSTKPTPTSGLEAISERLPGGAYIQTTGRFVQGACAIAQGWRALDGAVDGVGDSGHTFMVLFSTDIGKCWVIESTNRISDGQDPDAGPRVAGQTAVDLEDAIDAFGRPTDAWPEAGEWEWWRDRYKAGLALLVLPPVPAMP